MTVLVRLLRNRYVIVVGGLALATLAWNGYVVTHDDGVVAGAVVGPDGRPVAGATVRLAERTLTTLEPRAAVRTDAAGRFRFAGQAAHHFVLEAEHAAVGRAPRQAYRRYFRGQNLTLAEPLRLVR